MNPESRNLPPRTVYGVAVAAIVLAPAFMSRSEATAGDATMGSVNCRAVSTRSITNLQRALMTAYDAADSDARQNGTNGAYAVAATNSRMLIKRAVDQADQMLADHRKADPSTTTPAEGGTVKEHTRAIIEVLPEAAHWAIVSNIYHGSNAAREAFNGAAESLDQGLKLFVDASNCYMSGWNS